jgi:REP element-mobilizing transposase RayT
MRGPIFRLSDDARRVVEEVVGDHCRIRRWVLSAVNARTEHVHAVVSAPSTHPDLVLEQLQAWGTRRLRERGFAGQDQQVWTRKGSTRYLFDQRSLEAAIHYVINEQ